ncbi:MAG: hypothetical protein P0Y65_21330 [Candidatus Devosia phytovorans]|uniref:Pentapeptide repeat-containing protein n=1 Tax=Candidatus Devosia phytovorans TaxID=3121372 RepID=A0AAJ5VTV0_9HYPH|nr:hypothetical protein [Devosia sp.]WEK04679.1 MAG: hypothetical protein P0Y65_21330 [Devosia sp.]
MADADLQSDCSRCVGLCCIALAFSRPDGFGHDKMAGEPCYHLDAAFRCSIHERREDLGYDGCEAFDCLGAGQRATAVFATQNWRRDPAINRQLHARFSLLTKLQEMRQALIEADDLELTPSLDASRQTLLGRIVTLADGHENNIDRAADDVLAEANGFLRQLANVGSR